MPTLVEILHVASPGDRKLPQNVAGCEIRWTATTLDHAPGEWTRLTSSGSSDLIAWMELADPSEADLGHLAEALQTLVSSSSTEAWFTPQRDAWSNLLFSHLPPVWGLLARGPASLNTGVVRRSALATRNPPPTPLISPAWGTLVGLAVSGCPIGNARPAIDLPVEDGSNALPDHSTLPPLTPSAWPRDRGAFRTWLSQILPPLARQAAADPCDQDALQAGVWQCLGELDLSHRLCQEHEGEGRDQLCDYWHAIMHRREPDYGNSKYWFRQFGRHPAFAALAKRVNRLWEQPGLSGQSWQSRLLRGGSWDPFAMVDLAQAAIQDRGLEPLARQIQALELVTLLEYSLTPAVGG